MVSFKNLPKSASFTRLLSPDSKVPSIADAKAAPDDLIRRARAVDGSFTWLRPEKRNEAELVAVSPAAVEALGLDLSETESKAFVDVIAGQEIVEDEAKGIYPWAQAYAGFQFGEWAGQLGDGRVVSLFEAQNEKTGKKYELQLKGAGLTPYSRFADGKAVLRSSIREALVSEHLHALGIPTTRALSLVYLPGTLARRQTIEECAVVCRMAETWVRFGTFDFHRARGDRKELRKLADYVIDNVYGDENLRASINANGPHHNRYLSLFHAIIKRSASTLAYWQAYAFMNGVLNTDNTSIYGLSMDFGPFAFMDTFDDSFTPNHDDGLLRYSFKNQPSVVWWNLLRLGEDLGELIGAGDIVDNESFVKDGVDRSEVQTVIKRAEDAIESSHQLFKDTFLQKYTELMRNRLGLTVAHDDDHDNVISPLLTTLQETELDYNLFFRRLGDLDLDQDRLDVTALVEQDRGFTPQLTVEEAQQKVTSWITDVYMPRLAKESSEPQSRRQTMHKVNPKFLLRTWIMDEVIDQATREHSFDLYKTVQKFALDPFAETWGETAELEAKYTREPSKADKALQCSCSS